MSWNPFLDNDYGVHWSEWGPDMMDTGVTHGGGQEDFFPTSVNTGSSFWANPDNGVQYNGVRYQGSAPSLDGVPQEYRAAFVDAAAKVGIDPNLLISISWNESRFNPNAVSPAGAIGLMQFMPETAREYGIDPRDPIQSIYGAAQYVRNMLDMKGIDGNIELAVAAYNAGPGNVLNGRWTRFNETTNYVKNVMGTYAGLSGGQIGTGVGQGGTVNPHGLPETYGGGARSDGWNTNFKENMDRAIQATRAQGYDIGYGSGVRTPEQQVNVVAGSIAKRAPHLSGWWKEQVAAANGDWVKLNNLARPTLREAGITQWAAMPGYSGHQNRGYGATALDVRGSPEAKAALENNARQYNIMRPLSNENWHFQQYDPVLRKFVMNDAGRETTGAWRQLLQETRNPREALEAYRLQRSGYSIG